MCQDAEIRRGEATQLLPQVRRGDPGAVEAMLPLVYEQLRAMAGGMFRMQGSDHTLQPTALVHEAYVKLINSNSKDWKNKAHFCAVAATAMRQILQDHARSKKALKRGGEGQNRIPLDQVTTPSGGEMVDLIALDDAMSRLREANERDARIIELWFFGGLTAEEVAEVMETSSRTIERSMRRSRAWLSSALSTDGAA
jgi:RNA polymerase sigma-70 factor (ECF subfamily)